MPSATLDKTAVTDALRGVQGPGAQDGLVAARAVEWVAACDGVVSVKLHLPGAAGADDYRTVDILGLRQDWSLDLSERHFGRAGVEIRAFDVTFDYHNHSERSYPIDDPRFESASPAAACSRARERTASATAPSPRT